MFCKRLSLRFTVPALLSKLLYSELKSLKQIEEYVCLKDPIYQNLVY